MPYPSKHQPKMNLSTRACTYQQFLALYHTTRFFEKHIMHLYSTKPLLEYWQPNSLDDIY